MAQGQQQASDTSIKVQGKTMASSKGMQAKTNNGAANGQKPQPVTANPLQESSNKTLEGPSPISTESQYHEGERKTVDATLRSQSESQLEEALWKAENASLVDEFSALRTILGNYMDLQTRIFHDLGGEDDDNHGSEKLTSINRRSITTAIAASKSCRKTDISNGTATDAAEAAAAVATAEHGQRSLILSDAVRYIQHLETLQDNLASEKSVLESKVNGWEQLGLKVVRRLDECGME